MHYVPALDGLRGIAIAMVMAFHAILMPGGYMGVDVFFVLSGFLITGVLIAEQKQTGSISLLRFFARRALRLIPCLWASTAAGLILVALVRSPEWPLHEISREALMSVLYLENWLLVLEGRNEFLFSQTWSLAIEEQFYIIWAIGAVVLLRRRSPWPAVQCLVAVAILIYCWRGFLWVRGASGLRLLNGFDTHADGLMVGCAAAAFLSIPSAASTIRSALEVHPLAGRTCFVALCLIGTISFPMLPVLYFVWLPLLYLCTLVVIAEAVLIPNGKAARILSRPWLVYLGSISYGVYLWSSLFDELARILVDAILGRALSRILIGVFGGIFVAAMSYRYLERPILDLKRYLRRNPLAPSLVDAED